MSDNAVYKFLYKLLPFKMLSDDGGIVHPRLQVIFDNIEFFPPEYDDIFGIDDDSVASVEDLMQIIEPVHNEAKDNDKLNEFVGAKYVQFAKIVKFITLVNDCLRPDDERVYTESERILFEIINGSLKANALTQIEEKDFLEYLDKFDSIKLKDKTKELLYEKIKILFSEELLKSFDNNDIIKDMLNKITYETQASIDKETAYNKTLNATIDQNIASIKIALKIGNSVFCIGKGKFIESWSALNNLDYSKKGIWSGRNAGENTSRENRIGRQNFALSGVRNIMKKMNFKYSKINDKIYAPLCHRKSLPESGRRTISRNNPASFLQLFYSKGFDSIEVNYSAELSGTRPIIKSKNDEMKDNFFTASVNAAFPEDTKKFNEKSVYTVTLPGNERDMDDKQLKLVKELIVETVLRDYILFSYDITKGRNNEKNNEKIELGFLDNMECADQKSRFYSQEKLKEVMDTNAQYDDGCDKEVEEYLKRTADIRINNNPIVSKQINYSTIIKGKIGGVEKPQNKLLKHFITNTEIELSRGEVSDDYSVAAAAAFKGGRRRSNKKYSKRGGYRGISKKHRKRVISKKKSLKRKRNYRKSNRR